MSISQLVLILFLLSPAALAGNRWHVTLPGGNMRFQGEVIAEACRVVLEDQQMTVSMGQISSAHFHSAGEYAEPVAFDIHLTDCSTAVSQRVGVSLRGVADSREPDLLAVNDDKEASDSVAIAFFDKSGELIKLNHPPEIWKSLVSGMVTLHFLARYKAIHYPVTGGKANGQAWFFLTYE
ncbi:type 1 fimbrial protein [Salmonella enterica]|nr:type 1 fimbrial protein [Salmonella enterica]